MSLHVRQYFGWESLPPDIQAIETKPPDAENRGALVIRWPEDSPEVRWDGGELEDQSFFSAWGWVETAIKRAYEAGRAVGRS